jgi:hypothetical protein
VTGQRYALLVSTNLVDWSTQTVQTMSGDLQQYIDTASGPVKFYKTILSQ